MGQVDLRGTVVRRPDVAVEERPDRVAVHVRAQGVARRQRVVEHERRPRDRGGPASSRSSPSDRRSRRPPNMHQLVMFLRWLLKLCME